MLICEGHRHLSKATGAKVTTFLCKKCRAAEAASMDVVDILGLENGSNLQPILPNIFDEETGNLKPNQSFYDVFDQLTQEKK